MMRRTAARVARYERGRLVFDLLANRLGHSLLPLAVLFVAGLVTAFDTGFRTAGTIVLVAGSVASAAGMVVTGWPSLRRAYGLRTTWTPLAAIAGIVPYVFGLYVFFVAGVWHPVRDPTLTGAGVALFFLLAGFWYLRGYARLASLIEAIERTLAAVDGAPADRPVAEPAPAVPAAAAPRAVARAATRGGAGSAGLPGPALAAGLRRTGS